MDTRRCVVRGRVQGVGFRWFVTRNAEELGVRGTVRNRADGAVEMVLQADDPALLEAMIDRVRRGPRGSRVQEVECEPMEEISRYARFEVVR
ncbi:MAG TPA: acylphosphatase [Gemmatimonadota bacterium]|nr:acylphosphatase [Gemmatimonadota bacterium]